MTEPSKPNPVVVLKLSNDTEIIGSLESEGNVYTIKDPLSVISGYSQDHDSKFFYFEPAVPLSDDKTINIDSRHVIFSVPVREDIRKAYSEFLKNQTEDSKAKPITEMAEERAEELVEQLVGKRTIH